MESKKTKKNKSKSDSKSKSKTTTKKKKDVDINSIKKDKVARSKVRDEISAIVIMAIGIFFSVSMQTEATGELGHIIEAGFTGLFGKVAWVLPYYLIFYGLLLFLKKASHITKKSILLLVLIFFMISTIYSCRFIDANEVIDLAGWYKQGNLGIEGGVVGMFLSYIITIAIGSTGLYIFSVVVILASLMILMNTPISAFIENYKLRKEARKEAEAELELERIRLEEENQEEQRKTKELYKNKIKETKSQEIKRNKLYPEEEKGKNKKENILNLVEKENDLGSEIEKNEDVLTGVDSYNYDGNQIIEDNNNLASGNESIDGVKYGIEEKNKIPEGFGLGSDKEDIINIIPKRKLDEPKEYELDNVQDEEVEEKITNEEIPSENGDVIVTEKYIFPPIDLLNKKRNKRTSSGESLNSKAMKLEQTLQDFKVNAKVVDVSQGPAVTRYEIQPNTGVKVNSIVRLADDIALNLQAKSIRIEAPIPGKAAVGIEVENDNVDMVSVREIIESKEFKQSESKITFVVGKDISGKSVIADLKTMPHMLIAGATGSGKSVCINSIITSIMYKASPEDVKFVLIDPKVVELGNYNGIPHMLIPVVTEPSKAAAALNWAVAEMTDRYKKFAENGVKDLSGYNKMVMENQDKGEKLPQIVIVIDELADLMMASPSQVEEAICRLAQMARAAGMHLIVATQRPSVDVITGVIKANIPSRIAFAVSSQFDSRTILDMSGAEKLVGKGDMLFSPIGSGKPVRVQGTFISEEEVNNVINYVKNQKILSSENNELDILKSIEKIDEAKEIENDTDELLNEAVELVVGTKQASVSMLQRRFRIGYNRAARIIDTMEKKGVIGPADGSRPRQVIWSQEEFEKTKAEMISDGENY